MMNLTAKHKLHSKPGFLRLYSLVALYMFMVMSMFVLTFTGCAGDPYPEPDLVDPDTENDLGESKGGTYTSASTRAHPTFSGTRTESINTGTSINDAYCEEHMDSLECQIVVDSGTDTSIDSMTDTALSGTYSTSTANTGTGTYIGSTFSGTENTLSSWSGSEISNIASITDSESVSIESDMTAQ